LCSKRLVLAVGRDANAAVVAHMDGGECTGVVAEEHEVVCVSD
jgi:hypothetical protein